MLVYNTKMKWLLEQIQVENIHENTEYQILSRNLNGVYNAYIWQTKDGKRCSELKNINKMPKYFRDEENFKSVVHSYISYYEWYINELMIQGKNELELLKKGIAIYKGWKTEMQRNFSNTTFDIWLSIEYSYKMQQEVAVLRFNAFHGASRHYVNPKENVLEMFNDRAILMECVNEEACSNKRSLEGSILEDREEYLNIYNLGDKEKYDVLKGYIRNATASLPTLGFCQVKWFYDNCPMFYKEHVVDIIMKAHYFDEYSDAMPIETMLVLCDGIGHDVFLEACIKSGDEDVIDCIEEILGKTCQELRERPWYFQFLKEYDEFCDKFLLREEKLPF